MKFNRVTCPSSDASERLRQARKVLATRLDPQDGSKFQGELLSLAESGSLRAPHESVRQALVDAVSGAKSRRIETYFTGCVTDRLIESAVAFFREQCAIPWVSADNICIGAGVSQLFDATCYATIAPGDIILAPTPYYHAFADYPKKWRASFEFIRTDASGDFKLTPEALDDWFEKNARKAGRAKLLVIVNPSTIGTIYSREEMEALVSCARQHELLIFVDEIYRDCVFKDVEFGSFAAVPGAEDVVITAHSGSKTRGIADLRVGWLAARSEIVEAAREYCEHSLIYISTVIQEAAVAALSLPAEYLAEETNECEFRALQICDWAEDLNRRIGQNLVEIPCRPEAGHGILLSFPLLEGISVPRIGPLKSSLELTQYLMQDLDGEPGVVVGPGHSLGLEGLSVRIAFAEIGGMSAPRKEHRADDLTCGRLALQRGLMRIERRLLAALNQLSDELSIVILTLRRSGSISRVIDRL